ncbi:MAG TPA: hypothetical protein VL201_03460 [Patescibacteria group bacterium]|jgi:hypothetical protein|nr:hypothetical protein [Patescibacteria group bacterium]
MYKKNKNIIEFFLFGILFSQINFILTVPNLSRQSDEDRFLFPEFRRQTDDLIKIFNESVVPTGKKVFNNIVVPVSNKGYEKAKEFGFYASRELGKKMAEKKEQFRQESDSIVRQKDENFDHPPQKMLAIKDAVLKRYAKAKEFVFDASKKFSVQEKDLIQQNPETDIQKSMLDDKQELLNNHIQNTFNEEKNKVKQSIDDAEGNIKQNFDITENDIKQSIDDGFAECSEKLKKSIDDVFPGESVDTKTSNKALLLHYINQHKIVSGIMGLAIGYGIGYVCDVLYSKYGEQWKASFKRMLDVCKSKIYQKDNAIIDESVMDEPIFVFDEN